MKNYLLVLCCWLAMTVSAQTTIEPNLKWGKPTQQELTMTEYAADKDADAVELFRQFCTRNGERSKGRCLQYGEWQGSEDQDGEFYDPRRTD